MLWWCIKILGREYPRRPSPLAELLQGSPQVVDVVADLLQFGAELRLQALALGTAEPSGAAPLCLQSEALLLQLRDPVADLSSPAHVLASMIPRGLLRPAHIYALPQYVDSPRPTTGVLVKRSWPVRTGAMQDLGYGLPRIPLPRTRVNKGSSPPSVGYMEPLRGRKTLSREGASADERASQKGEEQKYPTVGRRALLHQRAYVGSPRLLRRGGHLLRAQGQGQRHSALHLRDDRRPEDSRGRRGIHRLASVARVYLPRTLIRHSSHSLGSGGKGCIAPPR